jgi:hypothetical protein
MKRLDPGVTRVLKRLHHSLEVILTCVRCYVAYALSLLHLEENDGRAWDCGRSFHSAPLGHQASARAGEGVPPLQASNWQELADGRNLREDSGRMEVPLPGRRQGNTAAFFCEPGGKRLLPSASQS